MLLSSMTQAVKACPFTESSSALKTDAGTTLKKVRSLRAPSRAEHKLRMAISQCLHVLKQISRLT